MPPENRRRRQTAVQPNLSHWSEADRLEYETQRKLDTPVAEMKLSVRVINTLEEYSVILCRDLMAQTYTSLMAMKNFGDKTLTEVQAAVRAMGLPPPPWIRPARPVVPIPRHVGGAVDFDL